ncbi:MAG: c-type cytochrome [Leptospira sp.]|nr:c-type cytochrome [Leptospira sp.]
MKNSIKQKKVKQKLNISLILVLFAILMLTYCGGEKSGESSDTGEGSKGIGPITSVSLGEINPEMANKGKGHFEAKCSACHKFDEKVVGPGLQDITLRRTPEWIMNMILNPVEMTQKDPIAKGLLEEHLTQMTFQNIQESEAREILEYFRKMDKK